MIKFQKLVTEATNLETCMKRHRDETHDGGYALVPLHVPTGDQCGSGRQLKSRLRK